MPGRLLVGLLVWGQVLAGVPLTADSPQPVDSSTAATAAAAPPPTADGPTIATLPPPPPRVKVNKTLPRVEPPPLSPRFSPQPTREELFRARVFEEPLVPLGADAPAENAALAEALSAHLQRKKLDDFSALEAFLASHPHSAWRASLLLNLGLVYRRTGFLGKALEAWESAYGLAESATDRHGEAVADRAVAELMDLNSALGRTEALKQWFRRIEGRDVRGAAAEKVNTARQALWILRYRHHEAVPSGPTALGRILAHQRADQTTHPKLAAFHATPEGATLTEMQALATQVGLRFQMAYREKGAPVLAPALVHFKVGHFAALLRADKADLLLDDPIMAPANAGRMEVSAAVLDEETSGYFLVREGSLPKGWRKATTVEANGLRGRCFPPTADNNDLDPPKQCPAMAGYSFSKMAVSLSITDTPVGYTPPVGPGVSLTLTYHQREALQPQILTFSNFGLKWNFDWVAYIVDTPGSPAAGAAVREGHGGGEEYSGWTGTQYAPHFRSRAILTRPNPNRYERQHPDGSLDVFAQPDGASAYPRRVFLTEKVDAQGNRIQFTYDAQMRLTAIQDAIDQVTTVAYELGSDPLKVTRVTDPFGRFATFAYNSQGQLKSITDVIGITSEFTYGAGDFITSLTTPYGTTKFSKGETDFGHFDVGAKWLEIVDPLGGRERVEFVFGSASLPIPSTETAVPAGFAAHNQGLELTNTFYWDKLAMARHPGDHAKARITHWLRDNGGARVRNIKASEKLPLENRVWYEYPGQSASEPHLAGTVATPSKVARVLDDGSTQLHQYEYNAKGARTREVDPVGRETIYEYDTNETDLLRVKQANAASAGGYDLLQSHTYNADHLPLTSTDAAGQVTTYTYNAEGQPLTVVTPPRAGLSEAQRTTTYGYVNGVLQSVTGPVSGDSTIYTYDGYGRVRTTAADGYTLTYDYDLFDRPTRTTFPDGTYEETQYDRLDAARRRDRLGRWTHTFYDAMRRVAATRDPAGRMMVQEWCSCGSLEKLIDPNGNPTRWERDLQGRTTKEVRADGSFKTLVYETTTSRLKTRIDAKLQETHYAYGLDGKLLSTSYVNAEHATPNVSHGYTDPATSAPDAHGRLRQTVDGTGTTVYAYHPFGQLGAGQIASVDGPLGDDTVSYSYDELGRVAARTLSGVTSTWSYDLQGRLQALTDPIGSFGYAYEGATARVATVTYPNGQTSTYSYLGPLGDHRLEQIHHKKPDGSTLNKFNYSYDAVGNIRTWTQQVDSNPAQVYDFEYDPADQLVAATLRAAGPPPTILKRYRYAYDPAGNRTLEQIDNAATLSSHDNMNRLLSQAPGGGLVFRGAVNEPASVAVGGQPASVSGANQFSGTAQVPAGSSQVTVQATDPTGNLRTNTYEVTQTGATKSFTYDANGNLTSDGAKTYEWDAERRLTAVKQGGNTLASFSYDSKARRASKSAAEVTTTYVYDRAQFLEERSSVGATKRHIYGPGIDRPLAQVVGSTNSYLVSDHLGSVTQVTSSSGAPTLSRAYDPWGNLLLGSTTGGYAFTGREWDPETELYYYRARYMAPKIARFSTEDPLRFRAGTNFYAYVKNEPISRTDPSGLHIQLQLTSKPAEYNRTTTCLASQGATCYAAEYDIGPCKKKSNCFGFDATLRVEIGQQFMVSEPEANSLMSADTPGFTLQQHEDLHMYDLGILLTEHAINGIIKTEGFKNIAECRAARAACPAAIDGFIAGAGALSSVLRDRP
jgi:RHS repeat-associated protein